MNFYILAGGKSKRMGQNKALMLFKSKPVIERVIAAIPANKSAIKVITNLFEPYKYLGLEMIEDRIKNIGPLAGIHAGLTDSNFEFNFFIACDLPFISSGTIQTILKAHNGQNVFGVQTRNGIEPLCAVYSKSCLAEIEKQIDLRCYSLQELIDLVDSEFIKIKSENALYNMNTPLDYENLTK